MALSTVLPAQTLLDTEIDIVVSNLQHPAVQKYLRLLAANDTIELLGLSAIHNSDASLVKALSVVQGKMQVLETLLSIQARPPAEESAA